MDTTNITVAMLYNRYSSSEPDVVPVKKTMDSKAYYMISAKEDICSIVFSWDRIASRLWEDAICIV